MKNNQYIYEKPIIYIIIFIIFLGSVILYNASSTLAINRFGDYSFYIDKMPKIISFKKKNRKYN